MSSPQGQSGGAPRPHERFGYGYDGASNLRFRTNNVLVQTFTVDALNQLSNVTRTGTLTVSGSTSSNAASVTVNGLPATNFAGSTFARAGFALADGLNTFTAIGEDGFGRKAPMRSR